jgi:hypothetical protein
MTTTTDVERYTPNGGHDVALFAGANADEILAVATDVATKFSDVVKQQRMFRRIGESDHIQIEAWQTIGALTGVVAAEGAVVEIPWPAIEAWPADEPPYPGREPRSRDTPQWHEWKDAERLRSAWELHQGLGRARALGRAYGFRAEFHALKSGSPVGWGEGRCTRGEASKVGQDDYALASMAQTRAQSRALGAPLKFVVKLAGYEGTAAEEMDGAAATHASDAAREQTAALERELATVVEQLAKAREQLKADAPAQPWGPVASDEQMNQAANLVRALAAPTEVDGEKFILAMGEHFDGVPVACVTMLRGLQRFISDARTQGAPENAPPPPGQGAYQGVTAADVHPPGRNPGD